MPPSKGHGPKNATAKRADVLLPEDDHEPNLSRSISAELFSASNGPFQDLFSELAENEPDDQALPRMSHDEDSYELRKRETMFNSVDVDQLKESDFADLGKDTSKNSSEVNQLISLIKEVVLFNGYEDEELRKVTDYMYYKTVHKGDVIINSGDPGDAFYVVKRGTFQCRTKVGDKETVLCEYNNKGYFGELALVNSKPRAASVVAITDGALWVLNATRYTWLKQRRAIANSEQFEEMIKSIPMFCAHLNQALISRLIDCLEIVHAKPGDILCRQGEPGDTMFFVMSGEVEATIGNRKMKRIGVNQFFGERALVLREKRAATCKALVKCRLGRLCRENFSLIIPDEVVDAMRKNIAEYDRLTVADDVSADDVTDDTISTASVYMEYMCQELRK